MQQSSIMWYRSFNHAALISPLIWCGFNHAALIPISSDMMWLQPCSLDISSDMMWLQSCSFDILYVYIRLCGYNHAVYISHWNDVASIMRPQHLLCHYWASIKHHWYLLWHDVAFLHFGCGLGLKVLRCGGGGMFEPSVYRIDLCYNMHC